MTTSPRIVELPPETALREDGMFAGGWWRDEPDGRILCELCPRACRLKPGDRGFCFVRQNVDNEMLLTTYGRSTGFCIDPIEKKPLNHFLPGTSVLSFGTAGCNLGCRFCQNWDISKSREVERLSELATPEMIAEAARQHGCHSVAYTYNDPVIWAEYAIDTAAACREAGIKSVAVTAGYITPEARAPFFHAMDAANVDLKAFTEEFYYELTASHLQPVLDTLEWLKHESDVWFEITNLIIPQANDTSDEMRRMCEWVLDRIGDDTPIHFTAFHPDFRMKDRGPTPHETLLAAKEIAERAGVKFAYVGNVDDVKHQSTYCPECRGLLIERNWYDLGQYHLKGDACGHCGAKIAGRFLDAPGNWGRKRQPVRISQFASQPLVQIGAGAVASASPPSPPPTKNPSSSRSEQSMSASPTSSVAILPELSQEQEAAIHRAASEIVAAAVNDRPLQVEDASLSDAANKIVMGAFVTLKRNGHLRACCGSLGAPMNIAQAIGGASRRTALDDNRLPPISPAELPHLDLDVTLLYAFEKIDASGDARADQIEIGLHGLQIRRGDRGGLLLPSVAVEHGYDAEEFLRQVCRKAGLPSNAWTHEDTQLMRFRGSMIEGPLDQETLSERDVTAATRFTTEEAQQLAEHCRNNLYALAEGRTPSFYLPGGADGDVMGVVLTIYVKGAETPIQIGGLGMRKQVPLQTTLNQYCEQAVRGLPRKLTDDMLTVHVSIVDGSAMHGVLKEPDLRGFDPNLHCLVLSDGPKLRWRFDRDQTSEQLVAQLAADMACRSSETAQLYGLGCTTSISPIDFTNVPPPSAGPASRPPAVAGSFYPLDLKQYRDMVAEMIDAGAEKRPAAAVMAPHAGWVYSGQIAADVFSQVEIPKVAIVIGPKHTRNGVEWAVAPHQTWLIPMGSVESDPELAKQLVEAIPGLQLDAAAHAREHAIEVELPLMQALSPDTRVVGIVLGGGSLEQMHEFADGLAKVIQSMDEPPLLVISSDMNHYATDQENRRLDQLALEALETLDTEKLFSTCRDHNISMCGLLPAVAVMETLKRLGKLNKVTRTGYATSADYSGDSQRVVGYAGAIFE